MARSRSAASIVAALVVALAVGAAIGDGGTQMAGWSAAGWCALAAIGVNAAVFVPSAIARTERFYDLAGAATYLTVTALAVLSVDDLGPRAAVAATMVAIWAIRLGSFLFRRVRAAGVDTRFDRIKTDPVRFGVAWSLQALWVTFTSAAAVALITGAPDASFDLVALIGAAVWLAGFALEVVADEQKRAFDAAGRPGGFIRHGLWAWSRHPNYAGEILLWIGMAVVALTTLEGWRWVALISPAFVWALLTRISGVPMLERSAERRFGHDPSYRDYVARTPVLIPRSPR
ncbi:MAG: DUF1295 domain-containing protein [Acidimicrobiales bacterium]